MFCQNGKNSYNCNGILFLPFAVQIFMVLFSNSDKVTLFKIVEWLLPRVRGMSYANNVSFWG